MNRSFRQFLCTEWPTFAREVVAAVTVRSGKAVYIPYPDINARAAALVADQWPDPVAWGDAAVRAEIKAQVVSHFAPARAVEARPAAQQAKCGSRDEPFRPTLRQQAETMVRFLWAESSSFCCDDCFSSEVAIWELLLARRQGDPDLSLEDYGRLVETVYDAVGGANHPRPCPAVDLALTSGGSP